MMTATPAHCMHCGYDLQGLSDVGTCPECGKAYDPGNVFSHPLPSKIEVCVRFLWPVAVVIVLACLTMTASSGMFGCFSLMMIGIVVLNGIGQWYWVESGRLPPPGHPARGLRVLAIALYLGTLCFPLLLGVLGVLVGIVVYVSDRF